MPITYTSGEQIEVYRFSLPVTVGVPLLALFLQAFLPRRIFSIFDLPLLVTIFFGMARRNPISGLFTGAAIGLAQDMLGPYPIGIYGIANTVVGYLGHRRWAPSSTWRTHGARFLVTVAFYLVHAGGLLHGRPGHGEPYTELELEPWDLVWAGEWDRGHGVVLRVGQV